MDEKLPAALVGIEKQLRRIADALASPQEQPKARWYEASYEDEYESYSRRYVSIEAYSLEEASAQFHTRRGGSLTQRSLRIQPLRPEQCKHCCKVDWHEDGTSCRGCGMTEEEALCECREKVYMVL